MTNQPEKIHFDRIMRLELEKRERVDDIKACWESAKGDLNKEQIADLKMAIKRGLADPDKLRAIREREDRADDLRKALGDFAGAPLGEAAVRAAQ